MAAVRVDELAEEDCYRLLAQVQIGRVVATAGALPLVVPVAFALDGRAVVFRTSSGGTLAAATNGTVVAFEADLVDVAQRTGWSVVVTGVAAPVAQVSELVRAEQLGLTAWAPGRRNHFVRITPGLVTGRRLSGPPLEPPLSG